jgi:hypothetical protein
VNAWWAEWSTYRPSDFLMFSPRIYWRLFESLNEAWWPAQLLFVGVPLAWLAGRRRRAGESEALALRGAALFLAVCWWIVAWFFLQLRYAPINWAASGFAVAFALQGVALLSLAMSGHVLGEKRAARQGAGIVLVLWGLLGHPLLAPTVGRPWTQAEVFGLAPDPTAIGTLGVLLLLDAQTPAARLLLHVLWFVPISWCALSAATLATMDSPQAWVILVAMLLAAAGALRSG